MSAVVSTAGHCGSPLCERRLKNRSPSGACPCGCPACDDIAVGLGVRPASRLGAERAAVVAKAVP